ncbi:MAG: hypothetical protein JXA51_06680 [Dehalococcoidales bacterium]|nr:hypothetical protein [Dehalococcoidales bacterium]
MRIKGFKIGKSKNEPEKDVAAVEETTAEQIVEMEDKLNGKTKNLEETAQELKELSEETPENEETPVGPHGPLDELKIEPEDESSDDEEILAKPHGPMDELSIVPEDKLAEIDEDDLDSATPDGAGEIKVVEVKAGTEPVAEGESEPTVKEESEPKTEELGDDSINSLFTDEEEEENPLANLIKAMPDVTASELVDDLEEIQGIIKEWQKG